MTNESQPADSEINWKPEQVLEKYQGALDSARARNDEIAYRAIYSAFVSNWNRGILRRMETQCCEKA